MRIWVLIFGLVALVTACSKQKAPQEGVFEELEFVVDSTKIGELVELGGVRFHAPAGWIRVDEETMSKLASAALRDTSAMQLMPARAFKRDGGGAMMLVSKFPKAVQLGTGFIPWAGEVTRVYREQRADIRVQEQWMSLAGVEALQLYSQSAQLVHIKIILNADEPVSLDYTVPSAMWPEEVRAVESSLGTLRKIYP